MFKVTLFKIYTNSILGSTLFILFNTNDWTIQIFWKPNQWKLWGVHYAGVVNIGYYVLHSVFISTWAVNVCNHRCVKFLIYFLHNSVSSAMQHLLIRCTSILNVTGKLSNYIISSSFLRLCSEVFTFRVNHILSLPMNEIRKSLSLHRFYLRPHKANQ